MRALLLILKVSLNELDLPEFLSLEKVVEFLRLEQQNRKIRTQCVLIRTNILLLLQYEEYQTMATF